MNEIEEIKKRYEKRKELSLYSTFYTYFNQGNLFIIQRRQTKILKLLSKHKINNLSDKKKLDIGCGTGGWLRDFIQWGATPENLYGIDLLDDRISIAKKLNPNINFTCSTAEKINYPDNFFDIVLQATCFTSILNFEMKKNIAKEMLRVLKNHGIVLWYDFRYANPKNPDVKKIDKKEIIELFPNCKYDFNLVTLAPPIVRRLAPLSFILCDMLEKIPFLKTHYLVVIRK